MALGLAIYLRLPQSQKMSSWRSLIWPVALIVGSTIWLNGPGDDPPKVKEARARREEQRKQEIEEARVARLVAKIEDAYPHLKDEN